MALPFVNSAARMDICSDLLKDARMQTNDEIRRERLAMLIAQAGSAAKVADRIGKAPPQLSQWINASPDSKTKRPRTMSDDAARDIEKSLGLERGWMDQPTTLTESPVIAAKEPPPVYGPPTLAAALPVVLDALASLAPDVREAALAAMKVYNPTSHNASQARAYLLGELSGTTNNCRAA